MLFVLFLAVCLPAGYAVYRGLTSYALLIALGLVLLSFLMRSEYRLPVVLLYLVVLLADSHRPLLHIQGLKLRWVVLGILVVKEMTYWAFAKAIRVRLTAAHVAFAAFLALALASAVYSVDPELSFKRALSVLLFGMVVFLYFWRQTDRAQVRMDLAAFVASLVPVVYLAEAGYALLVPDHAFLGGRLRGLSGNPNGLGELVMITLPLVYWDLLRRRPGGRRILAAGTLALGLGLLVLSGSRASFLALGVAVLLMTYRLAPRYFLGMLLAVAALFVLERTYHGPLSAAPAPGAQPGLAERLADYADPAGREEAWAKAWRMGLERPVWGHGFGTARQTFGELEFARHSGGYPHNFVLHVFLDLGFVGVAAVLVLHVVLISYAVRCLGRGRARAETGLPALAGALYLAGLANALFESWMFSAGSPTAFPFWLMAMFVIRYAVHPPGGAPRQAAGAAREVHAQTRGSQT